MAPAGKRPGRQGEVRGGLTELLPQSQEREESRGERGEAVGKVTEAANGLHGVQPASGRR